MQSKYSRSQPLESKLAWFRCREEGMSVWKVCELFGMSRKTYYKWRKRYEEEGVEGLSERSRRPKRLARLTPEPLAARVIRARRRKGYGPLLLAWYLRKHGGVALSPNGVYGVLKRAGLIRRRRKPGRPPRAAPVREPGELVQMDLKEPPRAAQGLRSVKYYQFTAIDKATSSVDFLRRAVKFFPFPIGCVRTDNGTEFTYWFMRSVRKEHPFGAALRAANIDHRLIPVGCPQANGLVERTHRTDEEEFYKFNRSFKDFHQQRAAFKRYLRRFNIERPNVAHNFKTPLHRAKEMLNVKRLRLDFDLCL
jgi:transposase